MTVVVQTALLSSTDDHRGLLPEKDTYAADLAVKNNDTVTVLYYNAGKLEIGGTRSFTPLADQVVANFWLIKQ